MEPAVNHIALVSSSFYCGGAERVLSLMANQWAMRGHQVTAITLAGEDKDFYWLDKRVRRIALYQLSTAATFWDALLLNTSRIQALRQALARVRPDVIISFGDTTNVITLMASLGLETPAIVSERIDPRRHTIGRAWTLLRRLVYPRADAIVVQTSMIAGWAERIAPWSKTVVIPNAVTTPILRDIQAAAWRRPIVLAIGRLEKQKGFDLLIRAFASMNHRNGSLVIVGEGADRRKLQQMADKLGIGEQVYMPGKSEDPTTVMLQADLFVLSSRYEGFPNVLLEAMACGLPVVGFDCGAAPREIIRDGIDGVLVPCEDVKGLGAAMQHMIENDLWRSKLAARAPEVLDRFGVESMMDAWDALIAMLMRSRRRHIRGVRT